LYRERHGAAGLGDEAVFLKTPFNEQQPRFSPDGRFVSYVSDETGRNEVYVRDFPKGRNRWQVSVRGGGSPRWSRSGRELFYSVDAKLMAAPVTSTSPFRTGGPALLFENRATGFLQFDRAPDGKRFLILEKPPGEPPLSVHVVQNWFEEFRGK
jgi:serine/threonine-protein kinase